MPGAVLKACQGGASVLCNLRGGTSCRSRPLSVSRRATRVCTRTPNRPLSPLSLPGFRPGLIPASIPGLIPGLRSRLVVRGAMGTPAVATSAADESALGLKASGGEGGAALGAVLFDVDGTLADSDPLHFLAFQEILLELGFNSGVPITEEFFRQCISGRHNPDITKDLFPTWDEDQRNKFTEDKEARFRRMALTKTEPVPGLHKFCEWVEANGLLRAAVTNAPRENAEQMIQGLGLGEFFHYLVIGAECERAKPHPDPYQKAMELLGVNPAECFAIEDSPAGIKSAVGASLDTIAVLTGQSKDTLLGAGANLVARDYTDPAFWEYVNSRTLVSPKATR